MAAGQLDVDAAPGLVDEGALADEAVVHDQQADEQEGDDGDGDPGDGRHWPRTSRQTKSGMCVEDRVEGGQLGLDLGDVVLAGADREQRVGVEAPGQLRPLEQQLHHPRVQHVGGEPPVGAGDGEGPVEVLGLQLDVAVGQPPEEPLHHPFGRHRERRHHRAGVHRHHREGVGVRSVLVWPSASVVVLVVTYS